MATSRQGFAEDTTIMLDAAVKALSQILSPRCVPSCGDRLGLALVLIVVLAIGLAAAVLSWFATSGEGWAEAMLGPGFHTPLNILAWIVSIAAGLGVVLGAVFLMPRSPRWWRACFVDEVADHVRARALSGGAPRHRAAVRSGHDRGRQDRAAHILSI